MPTLTYTKSGGNFIYVTTSGTSTVTGDTYVRYTTTDNNGSWIRVHIPVPLGHTYTLTKIYTEYTSAVGTTTLKGEFQYGIAKEKRDKYDYDKNSTFTYTVARGDYGSSAGNTYTASTSLSLNSGDWYLYIFVVKSGYAFQYITAKETKLQLTYTDNVTGYVVDYNANGGTGAMSAQEITIGNSITLPTNGFTAPSGTLYKTTLDGNGGKNGSPTYGANAFYKWRINSASGALYDTGANYTPTSNSTFYAQWYTPTTLGTTTRDNSTTPGYTVTFDATTNGGSCSTASLTVDNPVSHVFKNWNSAKDGSGDTWGNTTTVYQVTSSGTLYAQWTSTESKGSINLPTASKQSSAAANRTVTLNYNDGSGKTENKTSGATITYSFKGWASSSTAASGSTGKYTPASNEKLYAIFSGTTGTYSAIALPEPTRTGYTFMGWSTSSSATSGTTGNYTPTSSKTTLYAIWKPNGAVRIYIDGQGYRMAQVYLYANNKWNLTIPYLYNGSWKMST